MARWSEIEQDAPELAAAVRARFERGVNATIATLRADGAPRISGTELQLADGEVTLGMMEGSRKLRDVLRDPRVAIHSPTMEVADGPDWPGDAKLAGVLVRVPPPDDPVGGAGYFRLDVTEVVHTSVDRDAGKLIVESWHPGRGADRLAR